MEDLVEVLILANMRFSILDDKTIGCSGRRIWCSNHPLSLICPMVHIEGVAEAFTGDRLNEVVEILRTWNLNRKKKR